LSHVHDNDNIGRDHKTSIW